MNQLLATLEDNALIKLAVAGDPDCFAVLMSRHLSAMKRSIGSMLRNGTDADDLVQAVLLKVWRRLSTFRSESSFRTWMTRVAINEVLEMYRRDRRASNCQAFEDLDTFPSADESPHGAFVRREATKMVRDAVAVLPEMYKEVIVLREFEQLEMQEIAHLLRVSVPAVKTRVFRARNLLSAALQGSRIRGLTSTRRKTSSTTFDRLGKAA